ncbi:hypothetical protein DICPUDRAFT_79817 [Dictyostelium purpureum]|uniref:Uncharacterized protein n=1 Tax=Dictyostelium purpureum TaxID=5786 RepID=F0ZNQ1_DICPU|nr:uncharacterized protein DICPUDRAFT_79817 [Dictyostelium purpureum]EGC34414.1 hypothetical protein DICPUDRAFT_79817 [Dictyostelium purpureum]|eukprot:XP_003289043.1 hypothetical protein DICPUDRAFT_79817 [Dictyostelium purpureum]
MIKKNINYLFLILLITFIVLNNLLVNAEGGDIGYNGLIHFIKTNNSSKAIYNVSSDKKLVGYTLETPSPSPSPSSAPSRSPSPSSSPSRSPSPSPSSTPKKTQNFFNSSRSDSVKLLPSSVSLFLIIFILFKLF